MTEQEMVRFLGRGDLSAPEELIDRYTPYVSPVTARILGGRQDDVEELTADVFLAAWGCLKTMKGSKRDSLFVLGGLF